MPTPRPPSHLAAFENHLSFIASHRGRVIRGDADIVIESEAAGFRSWTPLGDALPIPARCDAVRLPPGAGEGWGGRLSAAGFRPAESLNYMWLADPLPAAVPAGMAVVRGSTAGDAGRFASVQSAGFATGDAAVDSWWAAFFEKMAARNIAAPDQAFYLALEQEEAAGCTLALEAAGLTGIYAVATRPDRRNRGISAALLARAARDAAAAGTAPLILQAMKGSYAEGYYARLGFKSLFELTMWRR